MFKKKISVCAPFDGIAMDITEVEDAVFAQLMIGDGCAIRPVSGDVFAPVSGRVELIAETGHAICLKTAEELEIMIHYGIDTVSLEGEGFDVKVEAGQQVKVGELLCHVDMEYFKAQNIDLTSPVLVLDSDKFAVVNKQLGKEVTAGEPLFSVVRK
ncbi:PTS sugar transporter subunit IIA [Lacrimispora brassicae]